MARQSLNTRLLNKLRPEHFRLPSDDSRKVKHLCRQRRAVLMELKAAADSDGTHVEVAVETIETALGMARACVFERLDELKQLGLLIDEELLGFKKPRRRRLDLLRAQELLGIAVQQTGRPAGLPDCVRDELWQQFVSSPCFASEDVESIAAVLRHQFHVWKTAADAETFVVELLRFAIAAKTIPMDLSWYCQPECRVEGCPGFLRETFVQEEHETDQDFQARWQREALPGDRVVSNLDFQQHRAGLIVTADIRHECRPE